MVNEPVATTLPADVPLIMPIKPLANTATLAGPPRLWPSAANAQLTN